MNSKHVAFGAVVSGSETVRRMALVEQEDKKDRPVSKLRKSMDDKDSEYEKSTSLDLKRLL